MFCKLVKTFLSFPKSRWSSLFSFSSYAVCFILPLILIPIVCSCLGSTVSSIRCGEHTLTCMRSKGAPGFYSVAVSTSTTCRVYLLKTNQPTKTTQKSPAKQVQTAWEGHQYSEMSVSKSSTEQEIEKPLKSEDAAYWAQEEHGA